MNSIDPSGQKPIKSIDVDLNKANNGDQPDLTNHKNGYNYKTGRVYEGTMSVTYTDGTTKTWSVHDGGYRTEDSDVRGPSESSRAQGDDSVTPAGDWKVSTTRGGKLNGFYIDVTHRSSIMVHDSEGKVGTHGCVGVLKDFESFACDMADTKAAKKTKVPLSLHYSTSDEDRPRGNRGDGKDDPIPTPPDGGGG